MRNAGILLLVLLFVAVAGCGEESSSPGDSGPETIGRTVEAAGLPKVAINAGSGEEVEVAVEIADDRSEQARGLMERTALAEDRGMLFVYPRERDLSFWMENTLIPLSIAYINDDGSIADILDMEPLDTTSHPSSEPVQYALEVNQGFYEEHGIEAGDTVELPPGL